MNIKAFSRSRCILFLRGEGLRSFADGNVNLISIRDSNMRDPIFPDGEFVLNLVFDDIEPVVPGVEDVYISQGQGPFTDQHKLMIDAFLKNVDRRLPLLLVNCHAGVSRSGAVALYAGHVLFGNFDMVIIENPNINPNRWVLQKLGILQEWDISQTSVPIPAKRESCGFVHLVGRYFA